MEMALWLAQIHATSSICRRRWSRARAISRQLLVDASLCHQLSYRGFKLIDAVAHLVDCASTGITTISGHNCTDRSVYFVGGVSHALRPIMASDMVAKRPCICCSKFCTCAHPGVCTKMRLRATAAGGGECSSRRWLDPVCSAEHHPRLRRSKELRSERPPPCR